MKLHGKREDRHLLNDTTLFLGAGNMFDGSLAMVRS